jgi:TRAP-type C4-dicarboxylate transport system permease large subunit
MDYTVPFLWPAAAQFGIHSVQFGIILTICLIIGQVTPPVGTGVFVASSLANELAGKVFREAVPLLIPFIIVLILVAFYPELVLFLPRLWGR